MAMKHPLIKFGQKGILVKMVSYRRALVKFEILNFNTIIQDKFVKLALQTKGECLLWEGDFVD